MTFPYYFNIGSLQVHPHLLFELLAYFIGFRLYLYTRRKERLSPKRAIWVVIGAIIGAAAGSKLLFLMEDPAKTIANWNNYSYLMGGKTIVGGLLGGLIGVEVTKKWIGHQESTGDDLVFPLLTGMMLGRIGCFLTGLDDHTYGTPTTSPFGVDFGDGILRHPTQLYEIVFLAFLGVGMYMLRLKQKRGAFQLPEGAQFQLFMTGYLLFRFFIDFIKPTPELLGNLNNMQWACLFGLLYYGICMKKWTQRLFQERMN